MDIPLPFGLVSGRLYAGVGDTADIGIAPDMLGLEGHAIFNATIDKEIVTTPGARAIILPQAITADITSGVLMYNGQPNVSLTASLGHGWQWYVTFTDLRKPDDDSPVSLRGFFLDVRVYDANAALVSGENPTITDLTEFAPVGTAPDNVVIAKGEKGDKGDTGPAAVNNYVGITQTAYNALVAAGTVNATTLYLITGP